MLEGRLSEIEAQLTQLQNQALATTTAESASRELSASPQDGES